MTLVTLLFLLLTGTAVQSLLPAMPWLGHATAPVLPALVVYYTLYRGGALMLVMAMLAGLFQDSISLIPLGYSTFGFTACALIMERYRDLMVLHSAFTHMVLTAAMHAVVTIGLMLLMLGDGILAWQPAWMVLKIPGSVILGLLVGPVVIAAALALEEMLGLIQGKTERYGGQRSFYGIR